MGHSRRALGRGSPALRHALCMIGLLVMLLVAILPAHANGSAAGSAEEPALDVHAFAAERDGEVLEAPVPLSMSRSDVREIGSTSVPGPSGHALPAGDAPALIGWYRLAAAELAVSADLLRALHEVESSAAPDGCVANAQGSGAIGPFQFKPATFRQYSVDGNHDGRRDICSFADGLFSAARYLRALGAVGLDDPETRRALARYGTDPDRVLALARRYRDRTVRAL